MAKIGRSRQDGTQGGDMAVQGGAVSGRIRRPSWRDPRLLVGLVLIAIAVAAVVMVIDRADITQPHFAAARDLPPGTVIADSDLVVVQVKVSGETYVDPGTDLAGAVVARAIGSGELIPAAALVDADAYGARTIPVETSLPLADAVKAGTVVDLWVSTDDDLGVSSSLVGEGLVVVDVKREDGAFGTTGQTVYVAVPTEDVSQVLTAVAADGDIAVVAAAS